MMKDKKLIKVVFEYDDKSSMYLDGIELSKWKDVIDTLCVMSWTRGKSDAFKDVKWKDLKTNKYINKKN